MQARRRVYQELPKHVVPEVVRSRFAKPALLKIEGLVARPRSISAEDLVGLAHIELREPFECKDGWRVEGLTWRGLRLIDVVGLARPAAAARWIRVYSGAYAVPVTLVDAEFALLADELNGEPLDLERGGPWRLVVPGGSCFASVKWIDCLELSVEAGPETGRDIAFARLKDRR